MNQIPEFLGWWKWPGHEHGGEFAWTRKINNLYLTIFQTRNGSARPSNLNSVVESCNKGTLDFQTRPRKGKTQVQPA